MDRKVDKYGKPPGYELPGHTTVSCNEYSIMLSTAASQQSHHITLPVSLTKGSSSDSRRVVPNSIRSMASKTDMSNVTRPVEQP